MARPLTPDERDRAVAMYLSGSSQKEVADHFGMTQTGISKLLIRNGVETRTTSNYPRERPLGIGKILTSDQEDEAEGMYASGWTLSQIGTQFGVARMTVSRSLQARGVSMRDRREAHTRHAVSHGALDVLTSEAAYWCGFLFTDGTVIARPGGQGDIVGLHIGSVDREHLEKFRAFLGSAHGITDSLAHTFVSTNGKTYTARPTSTFSVASDRLAERLRSLGRYQGPVHGGLASSRDFWRGAMDGDGCIGTTNGLARFELVGSERLLEAFMLFLRGAGLAGRMTVCPTTSGPTLRRVATMGANARGVIDLLYHNAGTALSRKMMLASEILGFAPPLV